MIVLRHVQYFVKICGLVGPKMDFAIARAI
jgi:hypothetical protein